ncbi:RNA polymerase sigma-70 factor [Rapidithrix thailandica]|uniref:RNA polymerase sigma-70 factor n=1 Tax=Rapidithrix thailandica TaxID=413964 RepID=A0AAW9SA01_9BACT
MKNYFQAIQQGQMEGLEKLYESYYQRLCRFAHCYLHQAEVAEDVVSEIFLQLWEKRHTLIVPEKVETYLFAATRNKCLNYLRDHQKTEDFSQVQLSLTLPSPEKGYIHKEQLERAQAYINTFPGQQKKIFILSRVEGFTYKEIAQILNLSEKTVEHHMGQALKKMARFHVARSLEIKD